MTDTSSVEVAAVPKRLSPSMIPLRVVQRNLTILWLVLGGMSFAAVLYASMFEVVQGVQAGWAFLLPATVPTGTMMLSVTAGAAIQSVPISLEARSVNRTFYWMVIGVSSFYLLCVLVVMIRGLVLCNMTPPPNATVGYSALQAVVAACLTVLYASTNPEQGLRTGVAEGATGGSG